MKKIFLTLILILSSMFAFSQTSMYQKYTLSPTDSNSLVPKFLIGENGPIKDTLGIVITIKQAQKIDNDYELFALYKGMRTDCDSSVAFLIQVVDDYKKLEIVAQQRFKSDSITILDGKSQIKNLKDQISIKDLLIANRDSVITDKNGIIDINKLEIKKYKKQRNRAIEIGSGVSAFLFWLVIGHPGIK